ncbi:MAG TPA: kelch repeat-containing protein, partial [Pseudonocardiaceae bacterium]|nr:kelch repeat-containing protein [Pseudonocardiaceae bacterium]
NNGNPVPQVEVYDPATQSWSVGASMPVSVSNAAMTVLDGKLYVVGGCDAEECGDVGTVEVYDPVTNTWSGAASYPRSVSFEACGTITGKLYCAGGVDGVSTLTEANVYDPATNTWSPIADLPADLFGSAYTAADGQLLVQDGVTDDALVETNQGWAYQPATNTWTALPNALTAQLRGGSALGFFQVGGDPGGGPETTLATGELLAGFATP